MPDIRHLSRPPVIEAMINFQANAAGKWDVERVKTECLGRWPEHPNIQVHRNVQIEMGPQVDAKVSFPDAEVFIFRSLTSPTAHQVRRDGYAFSRLTPYENWDALQEGALLGWTDYQAVLSPDPLHAVSVRFIDKLEFPAEGFRLSRYLTTPPTPPPGLDWNFHGFNHHTQYALPGSPFAVRANLGTAFEVAPTEKVAFVLDLEVHMKEPLSAVGRSLEDVLAGMRAVKNDAFFHLLTEQAIERYV